MRTEFGLCLNRLPVVCSTSSCGWPRSLRLNFFKTRSTSCCTCILAFALIPFMEYDVVVSSVFVNSFTQVLNEGGSSFATHCFASRRDCSPRLSFCSTDSFSKFVCVNKFCLSSATSKKDVVTSMGVV